MFVDSDSGFAAALARVSCRLELALYWEAAQRMVRVIMDARRDFILSVYTGAAVSERCASGDGVTSYGQAAAACRSPTPLACLQLRPILAAAMSGAHHAPLGYELTEGELCRWRHKLENSAESDS